MQVWARCSSFQAKRSNGLRSWSCLGRSPISSFVALVRCWSAGSNCWLLRANRVGVATRSAVCGSRYCGSHAPGSAVIPRGAFARSTAHSGGWLCRLGSASGSTALRTSPSLRCITARTLTRFSPPPCSTPPATCTSLLSVPLSTHKWPSTRRTGSVSVTGHPALSTASSSTA